MRSARRSSASLQVDGPIEDDQWIVHQRFDPYRPFFRVHVDGAAGETLYVSAITGELLQPIEAGVMTQDDIVGDLYDLCSGAVAGRQTADEITLFKNGGGGHLDLMTAQHILANA